MNDDLSLEDRRYILRGMAASLRALEFQTDLDGDTLTIIDPDSGNRRAFEAATFDPLALDDLWGDCVQLFILRGMVPGGEREQ